MKILYTQAEFDSAKSTDKLLCQCYYCGQSFGLPKKKIKFHLPLNDGRGKYCSKKCQSLSQITEVSVNCTNCSKPLKKTLSESKKSKNHFCSRSCSVSYNNKNKTHGTRRSKLEIWLEEQLTNLYPVLNIQYNQKSAIGSELDIYIPSLNLAFELNGIFHYEPIYGVNKLEQIQENDKSKTKACHEAKIDLCIIDTSGQKYVKPSTSKKYLNIIINIINERLLIS
jgi:hypothetical protein